MFTMSYDGSYVSVYVDNKVADGGDITGNVMSSNCLHNIPQEKSMQ